MGAIANQAFVELVAKIGRKIKSKSELKKEKKEREESPTKQGGAHSGKEHSR